MNKQINAGKYNKKIKIYQVIETTDSQGFPIETELLILQPYASVKTTRGFTLIANHSDFEKAYTNFTIRYSQTLINAYYNSQNSNRDILVAFRNKIYSVQYLNNIDEANVEIEMQCKEVMK
jgi:head-tail adaptor